MRSTLCTIACLTFLLVACGADDPGAAPTTQPPPTTQPAPTTGEPPTAGTTTPPVPGPTASATPTPTGSPEPTPTEEASGATETTAYFAREGAWVEPVTQALDEPTLGVAAAAMDFLVSGSPADPELQTLVPDGTQVLGVNIDGSTLVVDLSEEIGSGQFGSGGEAVLAQQFAYTGTQFDNVDGVQMLVEGEVVDSLYGHVDWSQPLTPDEFALSPVDVHTPEWGSQVEAGDVTLDGEANTFEANVLLRLISPDGTPGEQEFTTASCGSGCRGAWSHTFTLDGPGTWVIEVAEDDPSGGEGRTPLTIRHELVVP